MDPLERITELPVPPPGKKMWPWKNGNRSTEKIYKDCSQWPVISIVTPSFNQGAYLEETIRSVLLQNYPNLEYIIIDGGSSDESIEIIKKYERYLSYWTSEPDNGQSNAINKGIEKTRGEIFGWLNSDDIYEPDIFFDVVKSIDPSHGTSVVFGDCQFIDENGYATKLYKGIDQPFYRKLCYWKGWDIPQPTVFMARHVLDEVGYLDESMHYGLDYEWFLRIAQHYRFKHLNKTLARYRMYSAAKSGDFAKKIPLFHQEMHPISRKYWRTLPLKQQIVIRSSYLFFILRSISRDNTHWARHFITAARKLKRFAIKSNYGSDIQ